MRAIQTTRARQRNLLQFESIEPRRLLDASFSFASSQLLLDQWSSETLIVSESNTDYWFDLTEGTWNGTDDESIRGSGKARLIVNKTVLNSLAGGLHAIQPVSADTFDTIFDSVDFSGMSGLVSVESSHVWQNQGTSVTIPRASFRSMVRLDQPGNDFGIVALAGTSSGTLHDVNSITLTDLNLLNANAGDSTLNIVAGGDVVFDGTSRVGQLSVEAAGSVYDTVAAQLKVDFDASIKATGDIDLGRSSSAAEPAFFRFGQLVSIQSGRDVRFTGNSGTLNVQAAGLLDWNEESALVFVGANSSGTANLTATRAIALRDSSLTAESLDSHSHYFLFTGGQSEFLNVNSQTLFRTETGVYIAPDPSVNFGELTFRSDGTVAISEDSDTWLKGDIRAESIIFDSSGRIRDRAQTSIVVQGDVGLHGDSIELANGPGDELVLDGRGKFHASNRIIINHLGNNTNVRMGQLTFTANGYVRINESDGMYLVGTIRADRLDLDSTGMILNAPGLDLAVNGMATLKSASGIFLGSNASDRFITGDLASFYGGQWVVLHEPGFFMLADVHAVAENVTINRDGDAVEIINQALPPGWSKNLFTQNGDVWMETFGPAGNSAFRFRIGTTGVISSIVDSRNGQELVAPSYQGEITDRVVQWVMWEVGPKVRYDVPSLSNDDDRFNLTQAGTYDNRLNKTVDVDLAAEDGQLDVWSVIDQQWRPELQVHIQGSATALTRYTMLEGGAVLVRRVVQVGDIALNGQEVELVNPLLVGWFPWADTAFNSMAMSIDSNGTPDLWYRHKYDFPSHQNQPIAETRGWAMVYDRNNLVNTPTMSVVYGTKHGDIHLSDGSTVDMRRMLFNSLDFDTGMSFNPALWTAPLPAGSVIDQSYVIVPGRGITGQTAAMLDQISNALPEPQVYHPGANQTSELQSITNRFQQIRNQQGHSTDHLAWLV